MGGEKKPRLFVAYKAVTIRNCEILILLLLII